MTMESSVWKVEQVLGAPEGNEVQGELIYIGSLFPSPATETGEVKVK